MSMYYTFRSSKGTSVTVLRGDGPPRQVGGGGGWEIESRPRRVGLTIWRGREPYQMDVPILIDGWRDRRSIEDDIATLNQMQMGKDLEEPPTVKISGGVPIKGNVDWVISIDWGEEDVIWDSRGDDEFRLRQDAVIHMIQHNPVDPLKIISKGNLRAPRRYTIKKGDSLRSISQKFYGTPNRWKEIQGANNIRDPKRVLRMVGEEIKIP